MRSLTRAVSSDRLSTVAALGSDEMDVALDGRNQLRISGAAHGLDDQRKELGDR